jgi:hypothetical protein
LAIGFNFFFLVEQKSYLRIDHLLSSDASSPIVDGVTGASGQIVKVRRCLDCDSSFSFKEIRKIRAQILIVKIILLREIRES